jgi:hypothetical protein
MAQDPTDPTPAETPPEDNRPRPQYGELAPEGWSWTPPKSDAGIPAVPAAPASASSAPPVAPTADSALLATRAPGWDRPVTLGLLIFGLLATFFSISVLGALPDALQMLYTQQDLGTYAADAAVAGLIMAGRIVEVGIWLASAVVSTLLMTKGRRAFYVPLIGGVVSIITIFVFISAVLATDPTLLDSVNRP